MPDGRRGSDVVFQGVPCILAGTTQAAEHGPGGTALATVAGGGGFGRGLIDAADRLGVRPVSAGPPVSGRRFLPGRRRQGDLARSIRRESERSMVMSMRRVPRRGVHHRRCGWPGRCGRCGGCGSSAGSGRAVDHMRDAGHVDAAAAMSVASEHREGGRPESSRPAGGGVLGGQVALQRGGLEAGLDQFLAPGPWPCAWCGRTPWVEVIAPPAVCGRAGGLGSARRWITQTDGVHRAGGVDLHGHRVGEDLLGRWTDLGGHGGRRTRASRRFFGTCRRTAGYRAGSPCRICGSASSRIRSRSRPGPRRDR